ncbi:phosphotransferase [Thiocapsa rosea]|uniref:Phosphotransferase family enzyme n=1 Tax=Thiocapsa rosea TaxID=69360 RepID=A0A495VBI9_9GAMM|nr:phosphotransferase [Thiocapsa rosea]RKT46150.1 phosphotransferase family enzyme [Thiocapsa rosea]
MRMPTHESRPTVDSSVAPVDTRMPMLPLALSPARMQRHLRASPSLSRRLDAHAPGLGIQAVRMRRHKPGMRCLIEYRLAPSAPIGDPAALVLLGKIRAKGLDRYSHTVQTRLWHRGFGPDAEDGIAVPETFGVVPELAMWLQQKVSGQPLTEHLTAPADPALAPRIAAGIHKLHGTDPMSDRRHTLRDELRILHRALGEVATQHPGWSGRIERLLAACERLGGSLAPGTPCPSHRDCYADNLILDGTRLYLIDLDLYCLADPGLDMGNFIGHVTELSLRTYRDPNALADLELALEDAFVRLAGEACRAAVRTYAMLTLVRHIAISRRIPERRPWTPALLELCEERLGVASGRAR